MTGNKFFRSNRLSDAELKKRDYVARELKQTGRTTRSSNVKAEPNDNNEAAANFMAGVGVMTTPGESCILPSLDFKLAWLSDSDVVNEAY